MSWALAQYGMRWPTFCFQSRPQFRTATADGEATLTTLPRWHWSLPPAPSSFPDLEGLTLTRPEAEYLRERILTASPNSLLAALVRDEVPIDGTNFPWDVAGKLSLPN